MQFTKEQLIAHITAKAARIKPDAQVNDSRRNEALMNKCVLKIALAALTAETKVWEIENPGEGHYHIEHSPTGYRSELVRAEYILKIEPCPRCGNTSDRPDGAHYCHVGTKLE